MAFGNNDSDEGVNEINITPFVDVVLVLLVIFMVTAPMMIKEGMKVNLPKTTTADKMKSTILSVVVMKSGQIILNGNLITQEMLKSEAIKAHEMDKDAQAIIGADFEATHGAVVGAMDALKLAGINNLAFQVVREK